LDNLSTSKDIEDRVLKTGNFVVRNVEVSAGVPVFTGVGIVVQDTAVGIVERAFKS
jgi:uncharacterized protein (DUF433 family)